MLINTSEHEGFPNTFLQAWSRGIPVMSFLDPDNLIQEHNLGIVCKNIEEMKNQLLKFLSNKMKFSAKRIREHFETNLSIQKIVDKYEIIFLDIFGA